MESLQAVPRFVRSNSHRPVGEISFWLQQGWAGSGPFFFPDSLWYAPAVRRLPK
jgi:hypothetical protein